MYFNRLIVWFLTAALCVQALIPLGFMPDLQALERGVVTITICSGAGLKEITVDGKNKNSHGQKKQGEHNNNHCPFASATRTAVTVPDIILATPFLIKALAPVFSKNDFVFSDFKNAIWPRGPPTAP